MAGWLLWIGVAGFVVGLFLTGRMHPDDRRDHGQENGGSRRWVVRLAIAAAGAALAVLFAWPAWHLGRFIGPYYEVSETTGGALFACIFGLGGAALTGVAGAARGRD